MKANLIVCEEELIAFLREVVKTLPTTGHKFAAGAMLANYSLQLEKALGALADAEGLVDTDRVRGLVREGFACCGEKATFTVGGGGYEWLFKPVNVSVSEQDVLAVVERVEARARA